MNENYEVWTPVGENCSYLLRTLCTREDGTSFSEYLSECHAKAQQDNPLFKIRGEDILKVNGVAYTPVDSFAALQVFEERMAEERMAEERRRMMDRLTGRESFSHPRWNEET